MCLVAAQAFSKLQHTSQTSFTISNHTLPCGQADLPERADQALPWEASPRNKWEPALNFQRIRKPQWDGQRRKEDMKTFYLALHHRKDLLPASFRLYWALPPWRKGVRLSELDLGLSLFFKKIAPLNTLSEHRPENVSNRQNTYFSKKQPGCVAVWQSPCLACTGSCFVPLGTK